LQLSRLSSCGVSRPGLATEEGGTQRTAAVGTGLLPWRLRARGRKGSRQQPVAVADVAVAGQPAFGAGDLLQLKPGAWPSAELVMLTVLGDDMPAMGIDDLKPPAPWPAAGSRKAINGRLADLWSRGSCGGHADTSRASELAKKLCGGAAWQGAQAVHDLQGQGAEIKCSRCLLHVLPQHAAQASRSKCPVLQLTLAGQPWHEDEASMRAVLGRLRGYRRWCKHSAVAEASVAIPAAGTVCWVQGSRFQI
jgi:hypothetical protein